MGKLVINHKCALIAVLLLLAPSAYAETVLPECKSKEALSELQDAVKNSAYAPMVNVELYDLENAVEIPSNIEEIHIKYNYKIAFGEKEDKPPKSIQYDPNHRMCAANAMTNAGQKTIKYSFRRPNGIANNADYYVEIGEITEEDFALLTSDSFQNYLEKIRKLSASQ